MTRQNLYMLVEDKSVITHLSDKKWAYPSYRYHGGRRIHRTTCNCSELFWLFGSSQLRISRTSREVLETRKGCIVHAVSMCSAVFVNC